MPELSSLNMAVTQPLLKEVRPVWTSDRETMARDTALYRWPKIVQGMIDNVKERLHGPCDDLVAEREGPGILIVLLKLKKDIESNAQLRPIQHSRDPEVSDYNRRLATLGKCSWHACPWLYGECYLYRRVQSLFATSERWRDYDIFKKSKDSALAKSGAAVKELASRYMQVMVAPEMSLRDVEEERARCLFLEMIELALWGNATDLSLLHNVTLEDIQKLQGRSAVEANQRNIVDNDTDAVWSYLRHIPKTSDRRIDIVLDNAGFELFTDIVFALYLLEAGITSKVVLHAKCFPWFVSDALTTDVVWLLEHLESDSKFRGYQDVQVLTASIRKLFELGKLSVMIHQFWTSAASFYEMPTSAPDLFQILCDSCLTIWKGDLNYRKLTNDALWPHTTPFKTALGPLGRRSGLRALALRTNKSDTCVGVESEAKVRALDKEAPGQAWVRNGKYAVISFSDGR